MSYIELQVVKDGLLITHSQDDARLQRILDGAEAEACRYLNRDFLPTLPLEYPAESSSEEEPSSEDPVAPDVVEAVLLLCRGSYDGKTPDEIKGYREAAIMKLAPYRVGLGV